MKKLLTIILIGIAVSTFTSFSADKKNKLEPVAPNMEEIKRNTQNPDSVSKYHLLYKTLWRKFQQNDTNMSLNEYRHLYYGYTFQEDYNPYRISEFSTKIQPLYYNKTLTRAECDTIIKYAELSLADVPFDLNQMQFYIYALKTKKKNALASIWQFRLNHLIQAILSSGTGKLESPWVVISPVHEYNIANFAGLRVIDHKEINDSIDQITVEETDPKKPKEFYFNVSYVKKEYARKFKDSYNVNE